MSTMPTTETPAAHNAETGGPPTVAVSVVASEPDPIVDLDELFLDSTLPALPQTAARLLKLAEDPNVSAAAFALPIEADAALASQVLRFLNSSYFGIRQKIGSVKQGISLVGFRTVKNFVLWTAAYRTVPDPKTPIFSLERFRRDALRRGVFARTLTAELGDGCAELAFTAALMQDIAVPFLAKKLKDRYAALLEQRLTGFEQLSRLEREAFGWSHGDAASRLFVSWNLPVELTRPVLHHADAETVLADGTASTEDITVALSSLLPAECDDIWREKSRLEACIAGISQFPNLDELLAKVDNAFAGLAEGLGVKPSPRTLVEWSAAGV